MRTSWARSYLRPSRSKEYGASGWANQNSRSELELDTLITSWQTLMDLPLQN